MSGPQDTESGVILEVPEPDFDPSDVIAVDEWGNEWDTTGEFGDMDFRLVDDD